MKSERRHELQENELADWLERTIDQIIPHLKTILGVVALLGVAFVAYLVYQNRVAANQQAIWDDFYAAAGEGAQPEEAEKKMLALADAHPADPAGLWARLYVADGQLSAGVQDLFTNRAAAKPKLKEAVKNYSLVADNAAGKYPPLVERALFGEAKAYESLGEKSDLENAIKLYEQVAKDYPGSALAVDSESRVAALKTPAAEQFYDWFAKAEPVKPVTPDEIGTPGTGPAFNDSGIPAPPTESTVAPNLDPFKDGANAPPPVSEGEANSTIPPTGDAPPQ
jgi:hypothetical protein